MTCEKKRTRSQLSEVFEQHSKSSKFSLSNSFSMPMINRGQQQISKQNASKEN